MMIASQNKVRGLGIAAVGFLSTASSFLLLVIARLVNDQLKRDVMFFLPVNLIGAIGVAAGFLLCATGVVAAWLSMGNPSIDFGWLINGLKKMRVGAFDWLWKPGLWILLLATAMLLARGLTGLAEALAANLFLVAGAMFYAALPSRLGGFLVDELRRLSR